jgi:hypothetical protein
MRPKSKSPQRKKPRPKRSKFHPISHEMLQWSTLLEGELLTWPGVIAKPMFGFRAVYRGKLVFAAIPSSREFDPRSSFLLKFDPVPPSLLPRAENDPRLSSWSREFGRGWLAFTLSSAADLHDALSWRQESWSCAGRVKKAGKLKSRVAQQAAKKNRPTRYTDSVNRKTA